MKANNTTTYDLLTRFFVIQIKMDYEMNVYTCLFI